MRIAPSARARVNMGKTRQSAKIRATARSRSKTQFFGGSRGTAFRSSFLCAKPAEIQKNDTLR